MSDAAAAAAWGTGRAPAHDICPSPAGPSPLIAHPPLPRPRLISGSGAAVLGIGGSYITLTTHIRNRQRKLGMYRIWQNVARTAGPLIGCGLGFGCGVRWRGRGRQGSAWLA